MGWGVALKSIACFNVVFCFSGANAMGCEVTKRLQAATKSPRLNYGACGKTPDSVFSCRQENTRNAHCRKLNKVVKRSSNFNTSRQNEHNKTFVFSFCSSVALLLLSGLPVSALRMCRVLPPSLLPCVSPHGLRQATWHF